MNSDDTVEGPRAPAAYSRRITQAPPPTHTRTHTPWSTSLRSLICTYIHSWCTRSRSPKDEKQTRMATRMATRAPFASTLYKKSLETSVTSSYLLLSAPSSHLLSHLEANTHGYTRSVCACLRFRVQGSGFRVQGSGSRA